jgi:hypothetical protein
MNCKPSEVTFYGFTSFDFINFISEAVSEETFVNGLTGEMQADTHHYFA